MAQMVTQGGRKAQCSSNASESLDRFCSLPDHIIHHIFSFLSIRDTARVGILSKTCWNLYLSNPYLKFCSTCSFYMYPNSCKRFSDCVDRLLSLRNGLEICCLRLDWVCCRTMSCNVDMINVIDKWVDIAASCRVQEIDLVILCSKGFQLPQCIFSSKSLRILKLNPCYKHLKEPTGVFVSLEDLSLCGIDGSHSGHALKKFISTSCPSLKRLTIDSSIRIQNFSIINPSLEEFTLRYDRDDLREIDISTVRLQKLSLNLQSRSLNSSSCTIKINAPNLQDLKWTAKTANDVYLSWFEFLKDATLNVTSCNGIANVDKVTYVLQRVCSVRMLQVNLDVLEIQFLDDHVPAMFDNLQQLVIKVDGCLKDHHFSTQFLHNRLPTAFDNLQQLLITADGCLRDYHFPVLASMLTRSPNLETLLLKCSERNCEPDYAVKLWMKKYKFCKQNKGFQNLIGHQLKVMEIELAGKGHQVGVVKNMLTIAKGLTKMTIISSKANFKSLSEIGLCNSRTTSLPFELNLVEKEFHIEEHLRIRRAKRSDMVLC